VIGVDLSPIQPALYVPTPPLFYASFTNKISVPPNLSFVIEDIEDDWTYAQPFDYIHSRFMSSALASWTDFLTKCHA